MNSRDKGKRGELLWRDVLRGFGWAAARRGQQFSGGGDSPDVVGGPGRIHWEVKFVERLNIREAMRQAIRDSVDKIPAVAHKTSREDWLVTLGAKDFLKIIAMLEQLQQQVDDTDDVGP